IRSRSKATRQWQADFLAIDRTEDSSAEEVTAEIIQVIRPQNTSSIKSIQNSVSKQLTRLGQHLELPLPANTVPWPGALDAVPWRGTLDAVTNLPPWNPLQTRETGDLRFADFIAGSSTNSIVESEERVGVLKSGEWLVHPIRTVNHNTESDNQSPLHQIRILCRGDAGSRVSVGLFGSDAAGKIVSRGVGMMMRIDGDRASAFSEYRLNFFPRGERTLLALANTNQDENDTSTLQWQAISVAAFRKPADTEPSTRSFDPQQHATPTDGRTIAMWVDRPIMTETIGDGGFYDQQTAAAVDDDVTHLRSARRLAMLARHGGFNACVIAVDHLGGQLYPDFQQHGNTRYHRIRYTDSQPATRSGIALADPLAIYFRVFDRAGLQLVPLLGIPSITRTDPASQTDRFVQKVSWFSNRYRQHTSFTQVALRVSENETSLAKMNPADANSPTNTLLRCARALGLQKRMLYVLPEGVHDLKTLQTWGLDLRSISSQSNLLPTLVHRTKEEAETLAFESDSQRFAAFVNECLSQTSGRLGLLLRQPTRDIPFDPSTASAASGQESTLQLRAIGSLAPSTDPTSANVASSLHP
ncbi:MAG: hypothetical protein AAFN70_09990, partial [Planctomycetota bacterium]